MDEPRYRVVVEVNAADVETLGAELGKLGAALVEDPSAREYTDHDEKTGMNYELHVYDMKEAPGL